MHNLENFVTYDEKRVASFMKSREKYGLLSNMTGNMPLTVKEIIFQSSEALYQAFKFPHDIELQKEIAGAQNGWLAKQIAYQPGNKPMPEWDNVRVDAMIVSLAVKLHQHPQSFGAVIMETANMPIVEKSYKDDFWGAKPQPAGMIGRNVLGKLIMEMRELIRESNQPTEAAIAFSKTAHTELLSINGMSRNHLK